MVEFVRSVWADSSRWQPLVATFGLYLAVIVAFGWCYYLLYRAREDRFQFATNITAAQLKNVLSRASTATRIYAREIESMKIVRDAVASGALATSGTLANGHRVETRTYTIFSGWGESQDRLCLTVTDRDGYIVCDVEGPRDEELSQSYFTNWLDQMLSTWTARRDHWSQRAKQVGDDPGRAWGLWDFMYFSAITQTTVGYGDILPNATAIRMLVVAQVLIGYTFLVVVLNLVLVGR